MKFFYLCLLVSLLAGCASNGQKGSQPMSNSTEKSEVSAAAVVFDGQKIKKSDKEWQQQLSPDAYQILRKAATEPSFSGALLNNKKVGHYCCAACGLPLFGSDTKFKSGSGWPSFWQPIHMENVGEHVDNSLGMSRTEVVCNRCDGHLGHVFNDGPKPTGLRYCINSLALEFKAIKTEKE